MQLEFNTGDVGEKAYDELEEEEKTWLMNLVGDCCLKLQDFRQKEGEALQSEFKKLIAADPINGENYFYYGDCYFEMEELDSAKMMWKKGYEVDKVRALPIVGYGRILWLEGKTTEAKAFNRPILPRDSQ